MTNQLLTGIVFLSSLVLSATNFEQWQRVGDAGALKLNRNTVALSPGATLVNYATGMKRGVTYIISWSSRGTDDSSYKLYIEWTTGTHPNFSYYNLYADQIIANNGRWQKHKIKFTAPVDTNVPYIGISAVTGTTEIREFDLLPVTVVKTDSPFELKGHNAERNFAGLRLRPGQKYKLSFFCRTSATGQNGAGNQEFNVTVRGKNFRWSRIIDTWSLSTQRKELQLTAPVEGVDAADLVFQMLGDGTVTLDKLELELSDSPDSVPGIELSSPNYRNTYILKDSGKAIVGSIPEIADNVKLEVKLVDGEDILKKTDRYELRDGRMIFTLDGTNLSPGTYPLVFTVSSRDGRQLAAGETELRVSEDFPPVAVDRELNLRVNGQKFFPVSAWIPWSLVMATQPNALADDLESNLYFLARNGVNTVIALLEQPKLKEVMDLAEKYRMKVVLELRMPRESKPEAVAKWKEHIQSALNDELRNHPALLAYIMIDEPAWGGTPALQVKDGYDFLRKIDDRHPIWINEAPRNQISDLTAYAPACDIYGCDIYPVPENCRHSDMEDQTVSSVGKHTVKSATIVDGRKPVWMVLQAFAWGSMNGTPRVFPSTEELRFMVLDALSNGAGSISFWGLDTVDEPAFLPSFFEVYRELNSLSGVLTMPRDYAVSSDNKLVKIVRFRENGQSYILVVNPTRQQQKCVLQPDGEKTLFSLNGDRQVVTDGRLSLELPPFSGQWLTSAPLPPPAWKIPDANELEGKQYVRERLAAAANVRYSGERYHGKGTWIWHPGEQNSFSRCSVKRDFELPSQFEKAILRITADDEFKLKVNGAAVPVAYQGWSCGNKIDLTGILRPGTNTIEVDAASMEAPAGVLACLEVTVPGRDNIEIYSDANWLSKTSEKENWVNAEAVAEYGQGAWGDGVYFIENKK